MEFEEVLSNPMGWLLAGVGEVVVIGMLMYYKATGNGDLFPWWGKILAIALAPVIGFIWAAATDN
jgi:hypothetical protein